MTAGATLWFKKFSFLITPFLVGAAFWIDSLWFLIGIAFLPVFWALDNARSRRQALGISVLSILLTALAVGYPLLSLRSVQSVIPDVGQFYVIIGLFLGYILFLASFAVFALWGPFAFFQTSILRIIFIPAVWILFEIIKAKLSFGLQWVFAGEPLIEFLPLAIFARWGGVYILSILVAGFNVSFYEGLKSFFAYRPSRYAPALLSGTFLFAAVIIAVGWRYASVSQHIFYQEKRDELKIAVVQAGSSYDQEESFPYGLHQRTREIARPEDLAGVNLLILPGNYFGDLSQYDLKMTNPVTAALGFEPNTAVLAGLGLLEAEKKYQTFLLMRPDAGYQLTFKEILLPLADYIPPFLEKIYPLSADLSSGYTPGRNRPVEIDGRVSVGALSCSEEFVPSLAARLVRDGAAFLIVSGSNDDFGVEIAYKETLRAARFRALENGVFVVQAMKNGISAIIDPFGRVTNFLGKDEEGILAGQILTGK